MRSFSSGASQGIKLMRAPGPLWKLHSNGKKELAFPIVDAEKLRQDYSIPRPQVIPLRPASPFNQTRSASYSDLEQVLLYVSNG